jgi:hypothetical protein
METTKRVLRLALVMGVGAVLLLAAPARAQGLPAPGDGFTWERVGDVPIQPLDLAFGADATLWATGSNGPYRLDLSAGFPGEWVLLRDFPITDTILPLGTDGLDGDTLVAGTAASTLRSTDGGATWVQVHDRGSNSALYEVPAGYPYAGRIFTGASDGLAASIAYSDDRAGSFTPSVVPGPGGNHGSAEDFVALPPGSSHPGRILAAGRWGMNVSDDGGATFRESALWQVLYYVGEAVDVVEPDTGGVVGVMGGYVSGQADARAWSSTDGGETWLPDGGGQHLLEGPPNNGSPVAVLAVGASSVLVVLGGGTVYRSDDAGQTWAAVGRAPEISTDIYMRAAALGPDGRLYVGLREIGPNGEGWVYRTAEVLTAAVGVTAEPVSPPVVIGPGGGSFPFTVTLTNQTTLPQTVQAWSAASGPLSRSPVLGPRTVTLPAGGSVTWTLTQQVPGGAPAGTFPGTVVSADSFTVVKQGALRVSSISDEGWSGSGWEEAASKGSAEALRLSVSPNPFRGEATVTVTLTEPGEVAAGVYDVLGRRVALLHEGTLEVGSHAFALDGADLPAGVYVVRVHAGGTVAARTVTLLR